MTVSGADGKRASPSGSPRMDGTVSAVAHVMSRFPKLSETFILLEIVELERQGQPIEVFPLLQQRDSIEHREAGRLVDRAHYSGLLSRDVLAAQLHWLRVRPHQYAKAWLGAIRGNLGSPAFLARALLIVPKGAFLARECVRLGVRHVHAHYATHPALAAWVAHRLAGISYSFTAHAHDIYVERSMLEEKLRCATFVAAISEYNRRLLERLYPSLAPDRTFVVRTGVDPTLFRPAPTRERGEAFTVACVGSLEDYKGQSYLLGACAQLRDRGIDLRCLLVGEGENRRRLAERIADLGLSDRVHLLGAKARDEVRDVLAEADVLAMPSVVTDTGKMEGVPVALMEAMAMEVAVVATNISGVPELVEHERTGLLVPQRNPKALADALERLAQDPELRRRLAQDGRDRVVRDFDLRTNVAELLRLLHSAQVVGTTDPAAN